MATSLFLFPLLNVPQTFEMTMAGVNYLLTVKWNPSPDAGWVMDIADSNTNTPLASNIPFVTGVDCLSGLEYLGIQGQMVVATDGNIDAVPTLANLGVEGNLYFATDVANNG